MASGRANDTALVLHSMAMTEQSLGMHTVGLFHEGASQEVLGNFDQAIQVNHCPTVYQLAVQNPLSNCVSSACGSFRLTFPSGNPIHVHLDFHFSFEAKFKMKSYSSTANEVVSSC